MSQALKLLFDECCSRRLARELHEFYHRDYPGLEIRHVLDDWAAGTPDSQWLETLREDSSWIVITKDAGKNSAPEKLPLICREWNITHVLFTAGIIQKGFLTQKNALVAVWEKLFQLHRLPPGSQVKLGEASPKGEASTFDLRVSGRTLNAVLKELERDEI